jgi:hypothetical protein
MLDTRFTFDNGPNNPPTSFIFGPKHLLLRLYQLSPIEVITLQIHKQNVGFFSFF